MCLRHKQRWQQKEETNASKPNTRKKYDVHSLSIEYPPDNCELRVNFSPHHANSRPRCAEGRQGENQSLRKQESTRLSLLDWTVFDCTWANPSPSSNRGLRVFFFASSVRNVTRSRRMSGHSVDGMRLVASIESDLRYVVCVRVYVCKSVSVNNIRVCGGCPATALRGCAWQASRATSGTSCV
jgi:hypothetical protein